MHDKLVDYLLGGLECDELQEVEQIIAADAQARAALETLRRGLAPLEGDSLQVEAPFGLAVRTSETIRRVVQVRRLPPA